MTTLRQLTLVTGLLLLAGVSARAEVRLQDKGQGSEVVVRTTEQGPWTPVSSIDSRLLNPSGDYLGDGFPVVVVNGDTARVAWSSPAMGEVHFAEWTGRDWSLRHAWAAEGRVGTPRLLSPPQGGTSVIAWMETGEACTTVITSTTGGEPRRFEGEALLAAATSGSRVEVLTLAGDGALLLGTGSLPDVPGPIGAFERTVLSVTSVRGDCPAVAAAPVLAPSIVSLAPGYSLVTWWEGATTLAFCVSGPDGVSSVRLLEHPGRGVSHPSALRVKAKKLATEWLD